MMRFVYLMFFALAACSCGLVEIGGVAGSQTPGIWMYPGTGVGGGTGTAGKTTCYITGFDYPEGYDWRADEQAGSVKCSLVVFADMVPVMKIPVGESYEVGWGPDMHRIIDGHLYTDWSGDTETVIKKDGRELFRYAGREMVCGMVSEGEDIFILGQNRTGAGFCFRKNGEAIFGKDAGQVIGRLQYSSSGISFAYFEPIVSGGGNGGRYYLFSDGEVRQVAVREDVKKIWDVILHDGELCYIADLVGVDVPVTVCGDRMYALPLPNSSAMLACGFVPMSGKLFVEGAFSVGGSVLRCGLWSGGAVYRFFDPGYTVSSLCTWQDGICCLLNSSAKGAAPKIFRFGEMFDIPYGYVFAGSSPLAVVDGILYAGLSSISGDRPIVWKDGSVIGLDINGYISSICTESSNPPMKGCASCPDLLQY